MRIRAGLVALVLALASPSAAQSVGEDMSGEDRLPSLNFTNPGSPEAVARSMLLAMKLEQRVMDYCWEYGCLVIVNETNGYQVTGFHVDMVRRNGEHYWGPNQFGRRLEPLKATFRFKTGDPSTCDNPVRFVLKHARTKEKLIVESRASLCKSPHVDSLVRIKVVRPRVIVEEPDAGGAGPSRE